MSTTKITTGNNDRPINETIAQTGEGLPDDSGEPIQVDDEEVERVRQKLVGKPSVIETPEMPYDVGHAEKASDQ